MTKEQWETFTKGAAPVTLRPVQHFAKQIREIVCLNPKAKIAYSYDRWYQVRFEDGTAIEVNADYVERTSGMTAGSWVVAASPDMSWGVFTTQQLDEHYIRT